MKKIADAESGLTLKKQLDATYSAFHAAEQKGLFSHIQLKPIMDGPLAQRRHHKRSTSSNASSESNLSSNSICSSLSTSTTSTQPQPPYVTPTKKCPSSCGKQQEPCVFDFSDDYVSEYLQQQHDQQQQHSTATGLVFNRPITRSITHHNSRLGAAAVLNETIKQEDDAAAAAAALLADPVPTGSCDNSTTTPSLINVPPFKRQKRCSTILID